jgi:hypothetical protein
MPQSHTAPLVQIDIRGGLCNDEHACKSTVVIYQNGTYAIGGKTGTISQIMIEELQRTIDHTDFAAIERTPFTGTCPLAYDGPEYVYTIYEPHHVLPSCTYNVWTQAPLFKLLDELNAFVHADSKS